MLGDDSQWEPKLAPDVAAQRSVVLPTNHQQQEQQTGRRDVLLQRHQPADGCQRRQSQRYPSDRR